MRVRKKQPFLGIPKSIGTVGVVTAGRKVPGAVPVLFAGAAKTIVMLFRLH